MMTNRMKAVLSAMIVAASVGSYADVLDVKMLDNEKWWGAANFFGTKMPFTSGTGLTMDLRDNNYDNQSASMLISDKGRVIWCDDQAAIRITNGTITVECATSKPIVRQPGKTLRDAFRHASGTWFPSDGKTPDLLFFSAPQYNTWIELTYHQNEKDILNYAKSMLDNGLPPGVLMIDDTWQAGYGDWRFDPARFSDPKGMMDKLHAMGYKVILWMCPWVSMDTPSFRRIAWGRNPDDVKGYPTRGGFLLNADGKAPAAASWWNGYSALLDFTHPNGRAWFKEQLDRLVRDFGADGFKFDGGATKHYSRGYRCAKKDASSGEQVLSYAKFALEYPVCEYRNTWRFQGQPVVERLHDKRHSWEDLQKLVPDMIAGGLLGHPFMCPDMIGGGAWTAFLPGSEFDPELYVRSAQVHALCPMMQFSASPWRVLDKDKQQIIKKVVAIRQKFAKKFVDLARQSGHTGEPMLRNLEYNFPGIGYSEISDEFMMGDDLLVAPVVGKGQTERKVVIPPGKWVADDGSEVTGPSTITVKAPLTRLPHFTLTK